MNRSQPIDESNEKLMKKLNIKEPTEEEIAAGKKVVEVKTVYEWFEDEDWGLSLWERIKLPFKRIKNRFKKKKEIRFNQRLYKKQLAEYYPWSINAFLPFFIRHLQLYITLEKKEGHSTKECREYKISTAQETVDILKRLLADDYFKEYEKALEKKWGKFPYKRTTYANGDTSFEHLTPDGYSEERSEAYKKAETDEINDLKRLGELIEKNMMDWWD